MPQPPIKSVPLTDESMMPFGKFAYKVQMANVPAEYLFYLHQNADRNITTAPVLDYIKENLEAINKELDDARRSRQYSV